MSSFSQLDLPLIIFVLFIGSAIIVAVVRADRKDLPAIVRTLMRVRSRDHDRKSDLPSRSRPPGGAGSPRAGCLPLAELPRHVSTLFRQVKTF
jgi:hypothetical protein